MIDVAIVQLAASFGNVAGRLARTRELLAGPPSDIAVLPEAALTGYVSARGDFDLTPFAESLNGTTATSLASLAADKRIFLVAPLVERDGARCYNTTLVFNRLGDLVVRYRKRHPWYPERWASPGEGAHPIFELEGRRIALATCFDAHFLAKEASGVLAAADALIFPSAWVEDFDGDDEDTRTPLLQDLARRFSVDVIAANWARGDVSVRGQGRSSAILRDGTVAVKAGLDEQRVDASLP